MHNPGPLMSSHRFKPKDYALRTVFSSQGVIISCQLSNLNTVYTAQFSSLSPVLSLAVGRFFCYHYKNIYEYIKNL